VIVREAPNGGIVRVKDVARVELGAQDYSIVSRLNGKPAIVIPSTSCPVPMLSKRPQGFETDGRDEEALPARHGLRDIAGSDERRHRGMKEIIETLLIAIVLVILVVFLFLQDWRATLIPLLAVPVSLVEPLFLPALRLLYQHTFDVRVSPRDRPCGR